MAMRLGVAAALAPTIAGARAGAADDTIPPLFDAAAKCGLRFGAAIDREIFDDPQYAALAARHAAVIGNINALKFDWLRPNSFTADYTTADKLVAFAEQHGKPFLGHTLIWNDWPPPWLTALGRKEKAATFAAHIDEVMGRYRGRIATWVVVNEPFSPWDRQPGHYRLGPWFSTFGPDYIARALRRARAADPSARLILNEAFCERRDDIGAAVRPALLRLVKTLRDADVPFDAVGLQGHVQPQHGLDHDAYVRFMDQLAAEKVELEITELDVDDSRIPGNAAQRDAAVAEHYRAFVAAVMRVPALTAITTWGLSDKYSWYHEVAQKENPLAPHQPRTHPFDNAGQPKAAFHALIERLSSC